MKIHEAADLTLNQLKGVYDPREAQNIRDLLFDDLFNIRNLGSIKPFDFQEELDKAIKRLLDKEPIQYITETAHFFGYKFKVNTHVLIPRPETEELVDWILNDLKGSHRQLDVMDIGLGSGCISISLKKKKSSLRLFGVDYNLDILNVARINSKKLGAPMLFYNFDFLNRDYWDEMGKFNIIVSNPPYILNKDKAIMADNVLLYEPERALFAGEDHLVFYKAIHDFSKEHLLEKGEIYLEVHEDYSNEVATLFKAKNTSVEIRKDLQGKNRMIKISFQ